MSDSPLSADARRTPPTAVPAPQEQQVPASVRGAVDLGAQTQRNANSPQGLQGTTSGAASGAAAAGAGTPGADGAATGAPGGGSYRVVLTAQTFQEYAQKSAEVPVVVVLHARQSPESQQFVDTVSRVVDSYQGKLLLGTVDAMSEPQIAQAFQVESVPTMVAILAGRAVPLVNTAVPEEQLRQLFDELLTLAAQNGVNGTVAPQSQEPEVKPLPPLHQEALEKLDAGDLDGAAAAYEKAIAENPGDKDAKLALAQVHLLQRVNAKDPREVREAAASNPNDIQAAMDVADQDIVGGHVEDAFRRLLQLVRTTTGEDKDALRERLVALFDVVGAQDPRVIQARSELMRALF